MKTIRALSLVASFIATVGLTIWAIGNAPFIYAVGVFSLGTSSVLALITLIMRGE